MSTIDKNSEEEIENKKKIITGPSCSDCYHWHNLPDCPYNKIHETVKKCGGGCIVMKDTKTCCQYQANTHKIKKMEKTPVEVPKVLKKMQNRNKIDFKNKTPKIKVTRGR